MYSKYYNQILNSHINFPGAAEMPYETLREKYFKNNLVAKRETLEW